MNTEFDKALYKQLKENNDNIRVLDFGCGPNKFSEAIGIDMFPHKGVDVVVNLDKYPYPFQDNTFNLIICNHIIEHLIDIPKTMEEIYRMLRPDGLVIIRTPYFTHEGSFRDPTHRWHLTLRSMDYFVIGKGRDTKWNAFFEKVEEKLFFGGEFFNPGRRIVKWSKRIYEKYFCHIFPGYIIYWALRAKK